MMLLERIGHAITPSPLQILFRNYVLMYQPTAECERDQKGPAN